MGLTHDLIRWGIEERDWKKIEEAAALMYIFPFTNPPRKSAIPPVPVPGNLPTVIAERLKEKSRSVRRDFMDKADGG